MLLGSQFIALNPVAAISAVYLQFKIKLDVGWMAVWFVPIGISWIAYYLALGLPRSAEAPRWPAVVPSYCLGGNCCLLAFVAVNYVI